MSEEYQLTEVPEIIIRVSDQAFIPNDPDNVDYQEFCRWKEEGGVPTPYTPPPAVKE
jgi:hypothetical protein